MDKIKVLVVDDESRMRKLVHDFLSRSNYEVIEAADGEEAIDIFYADKSISLIILDVMMPKMDGWEVCRQIRKDSKVPIIMLTAKERRYYTKLFQHLSVRCVQMQLFLMTGVKILRRITIAESEDKVWEKKNL